MNTNQQRWRERFARTSRKHAMSGGSPSIAAQSADAHIEGFPCEPMAPHESWGAEMDDLHKQALRAYVLYRVGFMSSDLERARDVCQSPIEIAMLYALAIVGYDYCDSVVFRVNDFEDDVYFEGGGSVATLSELVIEPQATIENRRVDFLLGWTTFRTIKNHERKPGANRTGLEVATHDSMVLECDGHAWHDRTKQQASADRARDRQLQQMGYPVFRYTGSDIWRDVCACAKETIETLASKAPERGELLMHDN